jgi:hypothetical protein
MSWDVENTDEFGSWFGDLSETIKMRSTSRSTC